MAMTVGSHNHADGGCFAGFTPRGFTPRYTQTSRTNCFVGLTPRGLVQNYTPRIFAHQADSNMAAPHGMTFEHPPARSGWSSSRLSRLTASIAAVGQHFTPRHLSSTFQQPAVLVTSSVSSSQEQELNSYALQYVNAFTVESDDDALESSGLCHTTGMGNCQALRKETVTDQSILSDSDSDSTHGEEDLAKDIDDAQESLSDTSDGTIDESEALDTRSEHTDGNERRGLPKVPLFAKPSLVPKLNFSWKESVVQRAQEVDTMHEQEEQAALNSAREAQRELELLLAEMAEQEKETRQRADLKEASCELADALQKRRCVVEEQGTSFETPRHPAIAPRAGIIEEGTTLNADISKSSRTVVVQGAESVDSKSESHSFMDFGNNKRIDSNERLAVSNLQIPVNPPLVPKLSLPRIEEQDALQSAREAQQELELLLAEMAALDEEKRQKADVEEASDELAEALQRRRRVVEEQGESFVTPRRL